MNALVLGLLSYGVMRRNAEAAAAEQARLGRTLHRFLLCDGLLLDFDDPEIGLVCTPNINSRSDDLVPSFQCFGKVHPDPERDIRDMVNMPWPENRPHLVGPSRLLAIAEWARRCEFGGTIHAALWAPQARIRKPAANWPLPRVVWNNWMGGRHVHGDVLGFLDKGNAGECRPAFVIDCESIEQIRQVVEHWPQAREKYAPRLQKKFRRN